MHGSCIYMRVATPYRRSIMGKKTENISIIDKGLVLDGSVSCKGRLIIKGTVKGTLDGETVVIAEEGSVFAEATAISITIGGVFDGKIVASEELSILSTGNCSGTVISKNLVVEAGGILNADVACTTGKERSPGKESQVVAVKL